MPIYDYGCKACDHEFEREQRISEKPLKKCPACGKLQAKRLISRTSFVLKGGGWHSDLYSSGKPAGDSKDSADSGSKDSSSKGSKSGSGSDSASKSESKSKGKKAGGKEAAA